MASPHPMNNGADPVPGGNTAPPEAPVPTAPPVPTVPPARPVVASGPLSVRLVFFTLIIYNPLMLALYFIYLYWPSQDCVVGVLCGFDHFPGVLQLLLIFAGGTLLWLFLYVFVLRPIESPAAKDPITGALRALVDYKRVRLLLAISGMLLTILLFLTIVNGYASWITTPVALLTAATCFVAVYAARDLRRDDPYALVGGPLDQLGRLWPFSQFGQNRTSNTQQNAPQPGGGTPTSGLPPFP